MKRVKKILLGVAATVIVLAVGYAIFLHFAMRQMGDHMGDGIRDLIHCMRSRAQEVARPLTEADAVLRYNPTDSRFSFRSTANPEQTTNVTEEELSGYIQREMAPQPKLVVIYRQADFPIPAERTGFESRIRTSLQAGGAASVTFAVEQPTTANSLFE